MTVVETTEKTHPDGRWLWIPSGAVMFARAFTVFTTVLWAGVILGICRNDSGAPWFIKIALIALVLGYYSIGATIAPATPPPGKSVDINAAEG